MRSGDQDPASSNVEKTSELMVRLLAETRRDRRSALSGIDPKLMVHDDQPAWRVRAW